MIKLQRKIEIHDIKGFAYVHDGCCFRGRFPLLMSALMKSFGCREI
jgi:hypothetical protein